VFVGILQVEIRIEKARSLKDKRQVVKSILDRIRGSFNVSASEIDSLDAHQSAGLAFSAVSNDSDYVRGLLQQVVNHLSLHPTAQLLDHQLEVI
jgi:uncharacterized protein YlxP (DUF503 family)